MKELVRLFAELPTNAEIIPEVQQCLFSKRAMPNDWQDKLAVAGDHYDKLTALVLYFERLEKREKVNSRDKLHSSNINNQNGGKASRFSNANRHESNNRKHKQDVKSRGNITSKPNPKGKC